MVLWTILFCSCFMNETHCVDLIWDQDWNWSFKLKMRERETDGRKQENACLLFHLYHMKACGVKCVLYHVFQIAHRRLSQGRRQQSKFLCSPAVWCLWWRFVQVLSEGCLWAVIDLASFGLLFCGVSVKALALVNQHVQNTALGQCW